MEIKVPWSRPDINEEDRDAMRKVIDGDRYSQGKKVEEFFDTNARKFHFGRLELNNNGNYEKMNRMNQSAANEQGKLYQQ